MGILSFLGYVVAIGAINFACVGVAVGILYVSEKSATKSEYAEQKVYLRNA